jgi:hypothetical protein
MGAQAAQRPWSLQQVRLRMKGSALASMSVPPWLQMYRRGSSSCVSGSWACVGLRCEAAPTAGKSAVQPPTLNLPQSGVLRHGGCGPMVGQTAAGWQQQQTSARQGGSRCSPARAISCLGDPVAALRAPLAALRIKWRQVCRRFAALRPY